MKNSTIENLNKIANMCVAGLESEIAIGLTTKKDIMNVVSRTKYPTEIEIVKNMVRSDIKTIEKVGSSNTGLVKTIRNIMKTTEQFNYLANAISSKIKRRMRVNDRIKSVYCIGNNRA
jgi:phosphopantothenate synthetase